MKTKVIQITILLFLASVTLTFGAENPKDTLNEEGKTASNPILKKQDLASKVKIVDTYHFSMRKKRNNAFAIGYENYFKIEDFQSFKTQILDSLASAEIDLVLFINGNPFTETKMTMSDESNRTISFFWSRNDSATKAFSHFYTSQRFLFANNMVVGFGYCDPRTHKWKQLSVEDNSKKIQVAIIQPYAIWLALGMLALLVLCVFWLIIRTDLLYAGTKDEGKSSLSSTQMAFWTFIFFFSYIYLWIVNRSLAEIPDSTLALLGISTLTTAASKGVTMIKSKNNYENSDDENNLNSAAKTKGAQINSFYNNLISEEGYSTSIHRVQMLLFTGVYGVYYLLKVFTDQALPVLSENMLWLLGISSAAFVGVKSTLGTPKSVSIDAQELLTKFNEAKTKMTEVIDKTSDIISNKNVAGNQLKDTQKP